MCGIAGAINCAFDHSRVLSLLQHRGPDAQNAHVDENVTLYHTRLSIQDIALGAQPMHYQDCSIVFNGEIYNHAECRDASEHYSTHSDTETLLHLYANAEMAFLPKLDGMFAFAILDKKHRKLILARDRAGKKPLYFYLKDNRFCFASELNTLNQLLDLSVNEVAVSRYLRFGFMVGQDTPYQHVTELKPGSWMEISIDTLAITHHTWWTMDEGYQQATSQTSMLSLEDATTQLDALLRLSIQRRLTSSDLEVGAFLSGGIDSGLVSAIASQLSTKPLKTFTVRFSGAYDESALAQEVADRYHTDHTTIDIHFDALTQDIEGILARYGEPFADSSAIPSYYVSKEAKKTLTVILNGDGADELFGGYRRYVPFAHLNPFSGTLRAWMRPLFSMLPNPRSKQSLYNYLFRLAFLLSRNNATDTYLAATSDIFEGFESVLYNPAAPDISPVMHPELSPLAQLMLLDFNLILPGDLLVKMDIATMANQLEGRSPFLSKELLAFSTTLPDHFKIKHNTTKFLLRQLAKKYLPDNIIHQPKRGFEIPLKHWVNHQLNPMIRDYLTPGCYAFNFIDAQFVGQLLDNKLPHVPAEKRAKMLWSLFCLEVWYRNCVTKQYSR